MSPHNIIDLFGAVSGIRRIMLIGFGLCLITVFMTVVRLAVSELGWAKSWSPTSTKRIRRARAVVPPPVIPPVSIPAVSSALTLRTRIAQPREYPVPGTKYSPRLEPARSGRRTENGTARSR
jgi:hypothetical protein